MGDPRRLRKKYSTPRHPWQGARIEVEKQLVIDYGLKNKKEIWKVSSLLRTFTTHAKRLTAMTGQQAEREKKELLKRLSSLGLIGETNDLNQVLTITLKDLLERRLETVVFRKGLARSIKQARQFIVHEHIMINGKTISLPSFLITKAEEDLISFNPHSAMNSQEHPERAPLKKATPGEAPIEKEGERRLGQPMPGRPQRGGMRKRENRNQGGYGGQGRERKSNEGRR